MVDLYGHHEPIKDELIASILKVMDNSNFINGDAVKEFEISFAHYNGVEKAVPCANGTDVFIIEDAVQAVDSKLGLPIYLL